MTFFPQSLSRLPQDKKVFLFAIGVLAVLCIYRTYDYWVTGFYISDEIGYVHDAMSGSVYGYRWFFSWMNTAIFRLLGITTSTQYWIFLPFYMFLWGFITFYAFFRLLGLLEFNEKTRALSLFSSLFLVSFVLLSLGFLTEPVGLALVMAGIYFMVKWIRRSGNGTAGLILYPLFAAFCFSAAAGTREPYEIFQVGGVLLVPLVIIEQSKCLSHNSADRKRILLGVSICAFVIPTIILLQFPNSVFAGQVAPTTEDLVGGIGRPTNTPPPTVMHVSTVSTVTTITYSNGSVITSTATSTTTSIETRTAPPGGMLASTRLGNTLLIFVGGLVLGWGPILLLIGAAGFFALLLTLRKRERIGLLVWLLALFSFGSYFVVSYIFSADPYYLSFSNYSTIIRFSDTALPAFFLVAPFTIALIARHKRQTQGLVLILLLFVVAAIPVYETYAASNLASYAGTNPFVPSFRTDAVQVRDYVSSHASDAPFYVVGYPVGWDFTPGTDLLRTTHVYSTTPGFTSAIPGAPISYLPYSEFVTNHWRTFYVYYNGNPGQFETGAAYLLPVVAPSLSLANETGQFKVVSSESVLQGRDFNLLKVQISW